MTELRLTFDDGPSEWTAPILDLLAERNAKATFFVVGQHILGREPLLKRMVAEGHTVGNHTLTHCRLTDQDEDSARVELEACSRLIRLACGVALAYYRAPYLARVLWVDQLANTLGLLPYDTYAPINPDDWALDDPEEIVARVRWALEHGSLAGTNPVVCLHDGIPPGGGNGTASRAPTVEAVRLLLAGV